MTSGQFFLTLIIILIIWQTFYAYRRKHFPKTFLWFWLSLWCVALTIVLWPNLLSGIAETLGIGRGADVVIYFAIIAIFFALFRLYAKISDLEQQITQLARKITLS